MGSGIAEVSPLSAGYWCTACVVTRRGGVLAELNRSTARELEKFCRVESRGALGYPGSRQSCCHDDSQKGYPNGCPICPRDESIHVRGRAKRFNASHLSWHMRQWLPLWANLPEPKGSVEDVNWRCLHPLCTSADPKKFP